MEKIRILFVNRDGAGVNYWRTLTPAMEIERNHKDVFVEINPNIDFNQLETMDYLRTFNIIHYHTSLVDGIGMMKNIANELKSTGVVLVLDIDDYWELPKNHPQYYFSLDNKLKYFVTENIKIADYITTTNELFVEEIKKISGKDNVISLPNSVNPEWMKQFQDNRTPSPDGKVRIVYMGGSCYDDQTEILTEEGFKLFKDLNKTEKVATLNNDGYLEYQQPTNYTDESYSGDMFFGKNKNIDFAVTPNHNMFIHDSNSSKRTKPFKFEGRVRQQQAEDGIIEMKGHCDATIIIPNDKILKMMDNQTNAQNAFKVVDDVLCRIVKSVSDIITKHGMINRDMADLKSILQNSGEAYIGMGESSSQGTRAGEAAMKALSNPLLEDVTVNGAHKILVTIFGDMDVTIGEIDEAMDIIHARVSRDAHIFYGQVFDADLKGTLRIAIVATGFTGQDANVDKGVKLTEEEYWKQPAFKIWKSRKLT